MVSSVTSSGGVSTASGVVSSTASGVVSSTASGVVSSTTSGVVSSMTSGVGVSSPLFCCSPCIHWENIFCSSMRLMSPLKDSFTCPVVGSIKSLYFSGSCSILSMTF